MRILFVDDETRVLEGLERSLEMLVDDDWELRFVDNGAAALAELADGGYDALVTDMRMPGVNGAAVLDAATTLAPQTARIVLSGEMKGECANQAMARAHQILSKPSRPELINDVLRSSTRFRTALEDEGLRRAVIAIDRLPAVPSTYREIEAELERPNCSTASLAKIVVADPGLTARLLQVANSPYFGGGKRIDDIRQVISRLGIQTIAALALAAVFDGKRGAARELDLAALASRALRTAAVAGTLAGRDRAHAYLAGLLSEVGRIVLSITMPDRYDEAARLGASEGSDPIAAERAVCGVGHAEVGAYLLALWGLPEPVVDAVAQHHIPLPLLLDRGAPPVTIATAIAAAALDGAPPDAAALARTGLGIDQLERALAAA